MHLKLVFSAQGKVVGWPSASHDRFGGSRIENPIYERVMSEPVAVGGFIEVRVTGHKSLPKDKVLQFAQGSLLLLCNAAQPFDAKAHAEPLQVGGDVREATFAGAA